MTLIDCDIHRIRFSTSRSLEEKPTLESVRAKKNASSYRAGGSRALQISRERFSSVVFPRAHKTRIAGQRHPPGPRHSNVTPAHLVLHIRCAYAFTLARLVPPRVPSPFSPHYLCHCRSVCLEDWRAESRVKETERRVGEGVAGWGREETPAISAK